LAFGWSARLVLAAVLILASLGTVPVVHADPILPGSEALERLHRALATQATTRARLRVLSDAASCSEAPFVAYRRSDVERDIVDEWYVASQLWADAALLRATAASHVPAVDAPFPVPTAAMAFIPPRWLPSTGADAAEARCHLDKGFRFLDWLWDRSTGGYYPRSDLTGTEVDRGARYADDNALTGLALLAAAGTTPDPALQSRYLHAARHAAQALTANGLWDETFGGGFWWNTNKGDTPEGKPAQTNALTSLFFGRLYQATGIHTYRDWALRTLHWLDATLYEPTWQLYRWSVQYADPAGRTGAALRSDRYFNYDQGLAIEAQLLAATLDGNLQRLERARAIGRAVPPAFWNPARGGYNLEAGVEQVYTAYAAWTSLGHLALYEIDWDPRWLDLARANADALTAVVGERDGGHAYRYYRCMDRVTPGCESGQVSGVVDRTRDTAAQAWMQHLQTAIARRCACAPLAPW
jgi:uncharacterized protein YyaL (SSP411 family)